MSAVTNWQACGPSFAFVAHQALKQRVRQQSLSPCPLVSSMASSRQPQDNDDDDLVFSTLEKVANILSTPTPGFPSLPVVYPLTLASSVLVVPFPTAVLLTVFFIGFSFVANQVLDEKEGVVNFAVLMASIASAGLLSPSGFSDINGQGFAVVGTIGILAAILLSISEALPSQEEKILDEWDDRFDKDNR